MTFETYRLGHLGTFSQSGIDKKSNDDEIPVKIVNYMDVYGNKKGVLRGEEFQEVTASKGKFPYHLLRRGDVLITPSSETSDDIGHSAVVSEDMTQTAYSYHLVRFRPFQATKIIPEFSRFAFQARQVRAHLEKMSKGTTRKILTRNDFTTIPFALPDLATQRQIADFLDRETARIDLLIEKKQRFIEILSEKRFAETSSLLIGELFRSEDQKECSIPWITSIPADWKDSRMKNVCSRIIDCKNRTPDEVEDGEFLVVRTSCVRNGKFIQDGGYYTDERSYREWTQRGKPQKDDVIFTREAPVGEACIAPDHINFCLGQRTMIYRPDTNIIIPEYIIATIYSSIGKSYIGEKGKGSTVGHLRVPEVYNFPCLLPSIEAQKIILDELNKRTGHFEDLERATKASIDRLKEYRSALITAAVTGQIDVTTYARSGTTDRRLDAIQEEMGKWQS